MDTENLLILEYQENFADNLSSYVYGKILEKTQKRKCYYENNTQKRVSFEDKMSHFNLDYGYISSNRVKKITKDALNYNKIAINDKKIKKEIKKTANKKNNILNLKHFKIDDINLITKDIINSIEFNTHDFIVNYDILEEISTTESIGLYINNNDIMGRKVDWTYIYKAIKRLNKYIKKPKLYIFSDNKYIQNKDLFVDYKIVNLNDWREEFYFLSMCRHKIILDSPSSYSEAFWSIILNQRDYCLNTYPKSLRVAKKPKNWLEIS